MFYCLIKKKNSNNYIYIDDEYAGLIYPGDIKKLKLPSEGVISKEQYIEIDKMIYRRAFNKAINILSVTECCGSEIKTKLKLKEYPEKVINRVIEALYEYGYLNDRRFAEMYVRSFLRKKSKELIVSELKIKGIGYLDIEAVIDEVYEDENVDADEIIKDIIERKFSNIDMSDEKSKRKIFTYMIRRGFSLNKVNNYLT